LSIKNIHRMAPINISEAGNRYVALELLKQL
jgi:hypothetical protein